MSSTRSNIFANFAGQIWIALMGVVFVPVYLHYLSVEVYGIIGFFASLQTVLTLLDGGISPTLSREIARLSAFPEKAREMRDLSRTLEILCWIIAITAGGIAFLISPLIAKYWLHPGQISTETVYQALMLMSVGFAFQWVTNLYTGGLMGLQRQKPYNVVNIIASTVRSVGAFVVIAYFSPTIQAFLAWQVFTSFLTVLTMGIVYWRHLPATKDGMRAKFKVDLLRGVWRYAAGMTGISLVGLILTQSDKIILSRLLTLEYFGYYTLATTLAGMAIGMITGSIGTAYFPQFSQFVARADDGGLREIYHRSCQVMAVFLIPATMMLAFFSYDILLLWTRNEEIARNTYVLLTLVAIGTGLNGLMHLPYFIQLANGYTKLAFWQNIVAIILLIPFMVYATMNYGAVGGAITWVILNLLFTLVGMQIMHRIFLKGELKRWYFEDVGFIALAILAVVGAGKWLLAGANLSRIEIIAELAAISALAFAAALAAAPQVRRQILQIYKSKFRPLVVRYVK